LDLDLEMDFSKFDFSSGESHFAFMFKILDNKNFILGHPNKDNLIVFIRAK